MPVWIVVLIVGTSFCSAVCNVTGLLMIRNGQDKVRHLESGLHQLYARMSGKS